ncbi:hypothetical protein FRC17_006114 [Serendipita sp. 399]|nr:hypothetical protein FRC17_006114 [Serendipita sp. 399]
MVALGLQPSAIRGSPAVFIEFIYVFIVVSPTQPILQPACLIRNLSPCPPLYKDFVNERQQLIPTRMEHEEEDTPPEALISRLPVETLQDIFRTVAEESYIRNVRHTCRYWASLVASDHVLLRKILLVSVHRRHAGSYQLDQRVDYYVHTAEHLSKALEYIQNGHFQLKVVLDMELGPPQGSWDLVPWHRLTTQCCRLILDSLNSPTHITVADFLKHLPPLQNLTYLFARSSSSVVPFSIPIAASLSKINTPRLQSLKWCPLEDPAFNLDPFRPVFQGLKEFEFFYQLALVSTKFLVELLSSFRNLKHLRWSGLLQGIDDDLYLRKSVDWRFKLSTMDIAEKLFDIFPHSVVSDLVVYSDHVRGYRIPPRKPDGTRYFLPRLRELSSGASWVILAKIDAPNLSRLHLLGLFGETEYLEQMRLNPRFVRIEDIGDEVNKIVEAFFAQGPFTNLVELDISVDVCWAHKDGRLAQLLSVDDGDQRGSLVPQLKKARIFLYIGERLAPDVIKSLPLGQLTQEISSAFSGRPYLVDIIGWE